jgi:hypothetical protein
MADRLSGGIKRSHCGRIRSLPARHSCALILTFGPVSGAHCSRRRSTAVPFAIAVWDLGNLASGLSRDSSSASATGQWSILTGNGTDSGVCILQISDLFGFFNSGSRRNSRISGIPGGGGIALVWHRAMSEVICYELEFFPKLATGGEPWVVTLWERSQGGELHAVAQGSGVDDFAALRDMIERLTSEGRASRMIAVVNETYAARLQEQMHWPPPRPAGSVGAPTDGKQRMLELIPQQPVNAVTVALRERVIVLPCACGSEPRVEKRKMRARMRSRHLRADQRLRVAG